MTDFHDHFGLALASTDTTRSIIPQTKSRLKSGESLQKQGGQFAKAGAGGIVYLCGKNGIDAATMAKIKSKNSIANQSEPGNELFLYVCHENVVQNGAYS